LIPGIPGATRKELGTVSYIHLVRLRNFGKRLCRVAAHRASHSRVPGLEQGIEANCFAQTSNRHSHYDRHHRSVVCTRFANLWMAVLGYLCLPTPCFALHHNDLSQSRCVVVLYSHPHSGNVSLDNGAVRGAPESRYEERQNNRSILSLLVFCHRPVLQPVPLQT